MCLFPKIIKNRKYTANKKNGGIVPEMPKVKVDGKWIEDERVKYVPVGCGKCMECMKQKKNNWRIRLMEEVRNNETKCHFVTFTFSNESIKDLYKRYFEDKGIDGYLLDNEIAKKAVRLFLERWRKKTGKSVRHWLITELGHEGSENIHLHGLLWTDKSWKFIEDRWTYGYIWNSSKEKGFVNEKTVNYVTKYCTKQDAKHRNYIPIVLCSSGIGKGYFNRSDWTNAKFQGKNTDASYRTKSGHKIGLPVYYRNKIYSDYEREKLWTTMLDENVRYVNGVKIDMKNGSEEYYKELEIAREKNKRLGYGDDEKDWDKIQYERERRNINYRKRGLDL